MDRYNKQNLIDYYKSQNWAIKRNKRLQVDGYKCAKCGFTRSLEVHHINYERLFNEDVYSDLITLCKKCHKEIELQKKLENPLPAEHHFVYLAGKIRKNGWRGLRGIPYDPKEIANGYEYKKNEFITITGPFFIACDHGCYHGEGMHGVGADEFVGCMSDLYFTRSDVFRICTEQIDRAEILFAYIDCRDCYGTLAEIGYAYAKGKDVVIVFKNEDLKEEMWFIDKMQRNTNIASNEWIKKYLRV